MVYSRQKVKTHFGLRMRFLVKAHLFRACHVTFPVWLPFSAIQTISDLSLISLLQDHRQALRDPINNILMLWFHYICVKGSKIVNNFFISISTYVLHKFHYEMVYWCFVCLCSLLSWDTVFLRHGNKWKWVWWTLVSVSAYGLSIYEMSQFLDMRESCIYIYINNLLIYF